MQYFISILVVIFLIGCNNGFEALSDKSDNGRSGGGTPAKKVDFEATVVPIIEKNCTSCHSEPLSSAPFAFTTHEDVIRRAPVISYMVSERKMPPDLVDNSGKCQTYKDSAWLSDNEISSIRNWANSNPSANNKSRKTRLKIASTPRLPSVDKVLVMKQEYTPKPVKGHNDYRCFILDPVSKSDRYVIGTNTLPGSMKSVHHTVLFAPISEQHQKYAEFFDEQSPDVPGYECFAGPGVLTEAIGGWAPGSGATNLPEGVGIKIPGNRKLILQVHYHTQHHSEPDITSVELALVDRVEKQGRVMFFGESRGDHEIPPNKKKFPLQFNSTIPHTFKVGNDTMTYKAFDMYSVYPHMHLFGSEIEVKLRRKGSDNRECLMDVPRWDFHHQRGYTITNPIRINDGDTLELKCTYSTKGYNKSVRFGEGTEDEMCITSMLTVEI